MVVLNGTNVFQKLWYFLRTYILTLKRFDLFLQGALVVVILLRSNAFLLLRRHAGTANLPAFLEDWVIIGAAGAEFILGTFLAWCCPSKKQLMLSGSLLTASLSGLLVFVFPFQDLTAPAVELCNGDKISVYTEVRQGNTDIFIDIHNLATYRMSMLIIAVIMCSLAMISIWAHGLTYLDDHEPHNGPYFYGILISIRLSLGLTGENWLKPGALTEDWWVAHLSLSMLVLMFAVLFTLFPAKQPQWKPVDIKDDTGFFASLYRLMRNKMLLLQVLALSLINASLFGFVHYDGAYVQARFHVESVWTDPRTSRVVSDIFRAFVVIFFVMIFRVRFSDRRSDGVKSSTAARVGGVVAIFVAIFFGVITFLHCGTRDIAGLESGTWIRPQCSWDCGCDSGKYGFAPVCVLDTDVTHFSPCNAGCYEYENLLGLILFQNCTCGVERIVRGSCTLTSCQAAFSAYQILYTITVAVSAASMLMQGMAALRAVERWDKPIAQGFIFCIVSLITYVPGHILYMIIDYFTCAYYGENGASCLFHRSNIWWIPLFSALFALCSATISLLASKIHQEVGKPTVLENHDSNFSLDTR